MKKTKNVRYLPGSGGKKKASRNVVESCVATLRRAISEDSVFRLMDEASQEECSELLSTAQGKLGGMLLRKRVDSWLTAILDSSGRSHYPCFTALLKTVQ